MGAGEHPARLSRRPRFGWFLAVTAKRAKAASETPSSESGKKVDAIRSMTSRSSDFSTVLRRLSGKRRIEYAIEVSNFVRG